MNREMTITGVKTYATADNARKAVLKAGDEGIRHFIMQDGNGRFFPVFRPTENEMATTGIHFRWNVI
jgi:hypothetical protein